MELDNTQAFKANMICDGQMNTPKHARHFLDPLNNNNKNMCFVYLIILCAYQHMCDNMHESVGVLL